MCFLPVYLEGHSVHIVYTVHIISARLLPVPVVVPAVDSLLHQCPAVSGNLGINSSGMETWLGNPNPFIWHRFTANTLPDPIALPGLQSGVVNCRASTVQFSGELNVIYMP